jgi:hypothetical protein
MGFVDRYIRALGASQRQVEPLLATAYAATGVSGELGHLLYRVKYVDDPVRQPAHLARLLCLWTAEVSRRGRLRKWMTERTAWDAQAAAKLYRTVAELSLAHWLDGDCPSCKGSAQAGQQPCRDCGGTGAAPIRHPGGFVRERVKDMVSDLQDIASHHAARAQARLHGRGGQGSDREK